MFIEYIIHHLSYKTVEMSIYKTTRIRFNKQTNAGVPKRSINRRKTSIGAHGPEGLG